ncbi:MAG: VOC family protein [Lachnospiraceae bacterium]|nr:VOC family protein [Lachnospiraceae bacterium]
MRLKNILIVVNDIEKSKKFYKDLFGLDVILDGEGNVILSEGLVLQEAKLWQEEINQELLPKNNHTELYFEENDINAFVERLDNFCNEIQYVTTLTELPWGQKLVRFYDLDGNLIEVRTPVKR